MSKKNLYNAVIALSLFLTPTFMFGQTPPNLGVAGSFVLFTGSGAIGNTGLSQITGNVGTNSGATTGFGNVNGQMHNGNAITDSADYYTTLAYNNLGAQSPTDSIAVGMGGGQSLTPGVYYVPAASTLTGILILDAQNNSSACWVFQMSGAFSAAASSSVQLKNGAKACNIFWQITGAVGIATGSSFSGSIVATGAITLGSGVLLNGRALTTIGAVTVTSVTAGIPIGCGSKVLTGPTAPNMGTTACYALYTEDGAMTNTGTTYIVGDVGTNNGSITGFDTSKITGKLHSTPDTSTAQAKTDLNILYDSLNALPYDIELLKPALFGNSQVLTPHVYRLKAATHLNDTIFLDAQGNSDAVFVIQIDGALTTTSYSCVSLIGGTKSSNVFWKIEGAVDISDHSVFKGTIVANNGAISFLTPGDSLDGRALSTTGAINTNDAVITINSAPTSITPSGPTAFCQGDSVKLTASSSTSYLWSNGDTTQSITVKTSGKYAVTVANVCGTGGTSTSDSITIKVNSKYSKNISTSICSGDSILIAGSYRKNSGTYNDSLSSSSGCDSIIATVLTVNPKYSTSKLAAICNGDSILLAGSYRKASGTFNDTLNTTKGCDSIIVTVLTVNPKYSTNKTAAICSGDSISIAGTYRKTSGTYNDTLSTTKGCDSIIVTVLTVNPKYSTNKTAAICSGDSISIAGTYRKTSGTYNDTLSTTKGCDSIISTVLTVNPKYNTNKTAAICSGDSISIAGIYRKTSGTYNDTLSTTKGCDSIIVTVLTVNPKYNTNRTAAICSGDSISIAGTYRKTSGTYNDTLSTTKGCDSIIVTVLTVNPKYSTNKTAAICSGDSISIAGTYRKTSGTYNDTLNTTKGCDSIIVTVLTVNPKYTTNKTAAICSGDSIFIVGAYRKTSGTYNDTFSTVKGCDSIISTVLTVNPKYTSNRTATICSGDSISIVGTYRKTSGTYNDTLSTTKGCDSIIVTVLTVNPKYNTNKTAAICSGDSISIAGTYRKTSGTYNDTLSTTKGCDSIIVTMLTVHPSYKTNLATSICMGDSLFIAGFYRTISGTYSDSFTTIKGCDSIISTSLFINPTYTKNVSATICKGDSLYIAGLYRTASGTFADTFTTIKGCDSIIVTMLNVNPVYILNYAVSICNGDSMFIAGKYRSFTGMYADSLKTTKGCDSISYTALTVYLSYTKSATVSTCNGDSLFIAGKYRTIPGTYTDSLYTIHGCDSVVATVFTLFPSIINNLTASTCSGDSLMIAGKYRTIQGTYTDSLITTRGCDSIIVTVFTVYPVYSNNTALAICNGDSVVIGGIYRTTSGNYSNTYKTVNGCDSIIVTVLTVNPLPAANAGVGQTILLGASTVIGAPAIAGNTYSWTPSVGLSSTTVAEPQASPIVTTTYYLTETNTSTGCSKTSTVVITVVPVLDFFNGFSPNGDGYNDYWKIPVLDFYPVNKVQIINRWGNEVWVGDNYDNKTILWTGKNMNGDDLPDGTYYYIVTYGNVDKRGWVIIKR